MQVVIVESPSKAKTINKYLGSEFQVFASYGHIRDLPSKDGSVRPDEDFAMTWDMDAKSKKNVSEIVRAVKDADRLILATDPDREGEAISWHLLEVLQEKKALKDTPVARVAFNAITKNAVQEAMGSPREIDSALVEAYLARRALDYLVGFTLSPVLWRKLPGARSAGRVQSVALRLICERELEIEKFVSEEYWTVDADVSADGSAPFTAKLVALGGEKLKKFTLNNEAAAVAARETVERAALSVQSVEAKPARRSPPRPSRPQPCSRRPHASSASTPRAPCARPSGFMRASTLAARRRASSPICGRTASTWRRKRSLTRAAPLAGRWARPMCRKSPASIRVRRKNAQEAHECIRPTSFSRPPESLRGLDEDQSRLYALIWKRALASQMENARLERTTIAIEAAGGAASLRATGTVVLFDGFMKLYEEGRDDAKDDEEGGRLPAVANGAAVNAAKVSADQHFTDPPPRFTEASLVKKLEELGIGRPSTYASIISVLKDRDYVTMDKNRFIPDDKGRIVTAFLENFFAKYVQYDFTAGLEETLDEISAGDADWKAFLRMFWDEFAASVDDISELRITHVLDALNETLGPHIFPEKEDGSDPRGCPACDDGRLSLKVGRFGAFIGCSNYPDCNFTRQLAKSANGEDGADEGPKILGQDPETGLDVTLRTGRFGPYVQLGEPDKETKEKPKRASIPKGWTMESIDLERGLMLLSLPREVGPHPEDGEMIEAGIGRYGPYVKHGKVYANLPSADEVFEVGVNRAVAAIADKKANPRGRAQAKALKELGDHPETGSPVRVLDGRYGPYIKHEKINATLPKDVTPEEITMEQAVALIAAKAAKAPKKATKKTAKKATKKATKKTAKKATKKATKKTATKKTAAKKATKKTAKKATPAPDDAPAGETA